MRNYLYISDAKVDTYLPQFSGDEKRRIAGKLGFNIGVFEASVEGERLPLANRVHRLQAVEEKLREEKSVTRLYPCLRLPVSIKGSQPGSAS